MWENPTTEDQDEFGKVGVEMSYLQSTIHSDYESAESIADSDIEHGELRKLLASPLYGQNREDCKTSRISTAPGKSAAMIQERGTSAQHTLAHHSRRERLMSSSSQEPGASGKPDAMFSSRSNELGNQCEGSIFKFADPSDWGRSLLEGGGSHLLSQARSELMKQEHQI